MAVLGIGDSFVCRWGVGAEDPSIARMLVSIPSKPCVFALYPPICWIRLMGTPKMEFLISCSLQIPCQRPAVCTLFGFFFRFDPSLPSLKRTWNSKRTAKENYLAFFMYPCNSLKVRPAPLNSGCSRDPSHGELVMKTETLNPK